MLYKFSRVEFALTRDELLESMALIRAVRHGRLDQVEIPVAPLDILAQQIVAEVASHEWNEDALYELCCSAWPYRRLQRKDFDAVVVMLSEGIGRSNRRGAYLHRDTINRRLRPRRSARLTALTSGGAIPENADYRVVTESARALVGTLNEDFAIESMAGDVFILGNTSWRIKHVRGGEVVVNNAQGAPATIPFWLGEAPGRTIELSAEVSNLREELANLVVTPPTASLPFALSSLIIAAESLVPSVIGRAETANRFVLILAAAAGQCSLGKWCHLNLTTASSAGLGNCSPVTASCSATC